MLRSNTLPTGGYGDLLVTLGRPPPVTLHARNIYGIVLPLLPYPMIKKHIITASLAWILWVQYEQIGLGNPSYKRQWIPEAAYPDAEYSTCIRDTQIRAERDVESFGDMDTVKQVERKTLLGRKESIHIELKTGGSIYHLYVCFPDTVKPFNAEQ